MKLVFFGDSLTEGSYGGSYFSYLPLLLPRHTLINAGVGGDTVVNLLRRTDEMLALQPDGVFVMIGGNDAFSHAFPAVRSYYKNAKGIPGGAVSPETFARDIRELFTRLQLAQVQVWVGLMPNEYNPLAVATLAEYNAITGMTARSFSLPVLDLAPHFPTPAPVPERPPLDVGFILTIGQREKRGWHDYEQARREGGFTYTFDGLHLMPAAAEQAARAIAAFIEAD